MTSPDKKQHQAVMKLSERAMIAKCGISTWSGSNHDEAITNEVAQLHKADERAAGSYRKQLIARNFLSNVRSKAATLRQTHYLLTLPWDDNGSRILSASGYPDYMKKMKTARISFEHAAKEFVDGYPKDQDDLDNPYLKEAQQRLGTMFNKADYPIAKDVLRRFSVDIEIQGIPESQDFRTKISDDQTKAIVKDIERRTAERLKRAHADIYDRVATVTKNMVVRLRALDEGGVGTHFKDSLVYNVKQLADLIPVLNISGNPTLDALAKQLDTDLVAFSPEILRSDAKARKVTANKAEAILNKVSKYMA